MDHVSSPNAAPETGAEARDLTHCREIVKNGAPPIDPGCLRAYESRLEEGKSR